MPTETLNINGVSGSEWPFGTVAHVDEAVASADGSVMSTSALQGGTATVTFNFDNVSAITSAAIVSGIDITVRARLFHNDAIPSEPGPPGNLLIALMIGGVSQGTDTMSSLTNFLANYVNTKAGWNSNWSVSQLNGLQVRCIGQSTDGYDTFYIDCIDVVVTYRIPLEEDPPAGSAAFVGKTPTLKREDTLDINADFLSITGKAPSTLVQNYRAPGGGAAALTGKTPTAFVEWKRPVSAGAVAFTGKVPIADVIDNRVSRPDVRYLGITSEAPLVPTTANKIFGPDRVFLRATGQAPVADTTTHAWEDPAASSVAITGYAPTLLRGQYALPAAGALAMTGYAPSTTQDRPLSVGAGALAITGLLPQTGGHAATASLQGYAPTLLMNTIASPPVAAPMTITPQDVGIATTDGLNVYPGAGSAVITGYAPTLAFTSFFTPGLPGIINVTVDRRVEIIATPKTPL